MIKKRDNRLIEAMEASSLVARTKLRIDLARGPWGTIVVLVCAVGLYALAVPALWEKNLAWGERIALGERAWIIAALLSFAPPVLVMFASYQRRMGEKPWLAEIITLVTAALSLGTNVRSVALLQGEDLAVIDAVIEQVLAAYPIVLELGMAYLIPNVLFARPADVVTQSLDEEQAVSTLAEADSAIIESDVLEEIQAVPVPNLEEFASMGWETEKVKR